MLLASLWARDGGEDARPVNGALVAELLVSRDVDAAVVHLLQRA